MCHVPGDRGEEVTCDRCYQSLDQGPHGLNLCPLEPRRAAAVIGDDIPGGLVMRNGICHEDGSPRRFDSKSAIRAACAATGKVWGHDVSPNASRTELNRARDTMRARQDAKHRSR